MDFVVLIANFGVNKVLSRQVFMKIGFYGLKITILIIFMTMVLYDDVLRNMYIQTFARFTAM